MPLLVRIILSMLAAPLPLVAYTTPVGARVQMVHEMQPESKSRIGYMTPLGSWTGLQRTIGTSIWLQGTRTPLSTMRLVRASCVGSRRCRLPVAMLMIWGVVLVFRRIFRASFFKVATGSVIRGRTSGSPPSMSRLGLLSGGFSRLIGRPPKSGASRSTIWILPNSWQTLKSTCLTKAGKVSSVLPR